MLAIVFVLIAVVWRVALTNAHNFTPVLGSLLFFGSRMPRRWLWAPVAAMGRLLAMPGRICSLCQSLEDGEELS